LNVRIFLLLWCRALMISQDSFATPRPLFPEFSQIRRICERRCSSRPRMLPPASRSWISSPSSLSAPYFSPPNPLSFFLNASTMSAHLFRLSISQNRVGRTSGFFFLPPPFAFHCPPCFPLDLLNSVSSMDVLRPRFREDAPHQASTRSLCSQVFRAVFFASSQSYLLFFPPFLSPPPKQ